MRPARPFIRVHGALLCLSILFCVVVLMGSGLIRREELLVSTLIAFVFSELSLGVAHYCGHVLQRRVDSNVASSRR
jgi:membrane-associated PAP2 superfamily phosphatase